MAVAGCLLVYLRDHVLALNIKDNIEIVWRPDRENNVLKNQRHWYNSLLSLNHRDINVLLSTSLLKLLVCTGVLQTNIWETNEEISYFREKLKDGDSRL